MLTRLISYCSPTSGFQNNVLWDPVGNPYKNVNYLNLQLTRSRSDVFQELNENATKDRIVIFQRQRVEYDFYILARKQYLDYLSRIGLNDTVQLEFLETGETYTITNLRMADEGEPADVVGLVKFTFDLLAITSSNCDQNNYTLGSC